MSQPLLYCVDHDPVSRIVLESMFERDYTVESFADAESCLARVEDRLPDLMLLDVELPMMNGYGLCRQIKSEPVLRSIPVLFISHDEDLAARIEAYESGGEDFILKPYAVEEVRRRVAVVRRTLEEASRLRGQISDSELLSSLLLSSMDEYAVLIKFMRVLNESEHVEAIAQSLLTMLHAFRLKGAVQIRDPWTSLTLSEEGRDRPLEKAVIEHLSSMERIFEFKSRSVYNFQHVTLLVNNMPTHDAELCGRLRDHLAIAAEMAEARVQSVIGQHSLQLAQQGLAGVLEDTSRALSTYVDNQRQLRKQGAEDVQALINRLTLSIVPLGLNSELEEEILELVDARTHDILQRFLSSDDTAETLTSLIERLHQVLRQSR